jgi:uncharacterized protein (TIGR02996 family)
MSEKDDLLRAICERPDDDAVRLVYADWLDDHGDADRAELIRVQVALARAGPDGPDRPALAERERHVLRSNRKRWLAEGPSWAARGELVRGFLVPRLKERVEKFVKRDPATLFPFPLWCFTLTMAEGGVARLADCPLLARAVELNMTSNAIGPSGVKELAASPHMGNVEVLSLRRNWMRAAGMQGLVERLRAPRLHSLDLAGNWLDDDAAAALAEAPWLEGVTVLSLRNNWLRDAGGAALAASRRLGRLEELDLGDNNLGDAAARAFAQSERLPRLRRLTLARQITDAGAAALMGSAWMRRLERLALGENWQLSPSGRVALRTAFGAHVRT